MFALSCESTLTAEKIIKKSLEEAHGGIANWEKINRVFYEKTTIVYDSLGNIESSTKQKFQTVVQPDFFSEMFSYNENIRKHMILKDEKIQLFINGEPQVEIEALQKARKELIGAHYVLWQPYKLLTDDVELTLQGKVFLEDQTEAYKIKAMYPNSKTVWWYYFDTNTFLLKENLVKHGTTYSQIKNIAHEGDTGFQLHKKRESYTIDSTKNQKYLRASYTYKITDLK
ncbi:hypothetical protein [uncultured Kordia sp.]|uniref:hypothetical protein n=1 Tax=uncultured Kordia sp. TaxID=507699 RepID=UPI002611C941|nr:hypothetical protein [uncultured Kordia sp.]